MLGVDSRVGNPHDAKHDATGATADATRSGDARVPCTRTAFRCNCQTCTPAPLVLTRDRRIICPNAMHNSHALFILTSTQAHRSTVKPLISGMFGDSGYLDGDCALKLNLDQTSKYLKDSPSSEPLSPRPPPLAGR